MVQVLTTTLIKILASSSKKWRLVSRDSHSHPMDQVQVTTVLILLTNKLMWEQQPLISRMRLGEKSLKPINILDLAHSLTSPTLAMTPEAWRLVSVVVTDLLKVLDLATILLKHLLSSHNLKMQFSTRMELALGKVTSTEQVALAATQFKTNSLIIWKTSALV